MQGLISHAEVVEREAGNGLEQPGDSNHSPAATWGRSTSLTSRFSRSLIEEADPADEVTLYEQGQPSDTFTLILQGKVLIRTGGPPPLLADRSLSGHNDLNFETSPVLFARLFLPYSCCAARLVMPPHKAFTFLRPCFHILERDMAIVTLLQTTQFCKSFWEKKPECVTFLHGSILVALPLAQVRKPSSWRWAPGTAWETGP